jgi:hypothetical protein
MPQTCRLLQVTRLMNGHGMFQGFPECGGGFRRHEIKEVDKITGNGIVDGNPPLSIFLIDRNRVPVKSRTGLKDAGTKAHQKCFYLMRLPLD